MVAYRRSRRPDDRLMESREHKPSWSGVPHELVAQLGDLLPARIAGTEIAWGGFTPSATFLIRERAGSRILLGATLAAASLYVVGLIALGTLPSGRFAAGPHWRRTRDPDLHAHP